LGKEEDKDEELDDRKARSETKRENAENPRLIK